jgi:hypothetical protein
VVAARIIALVALAILIVVMMRVTVDLIVRGANKVRTVRQEGGGLKQKLVAELDGGQNEPSVARAHGAHFRVTKDGQLRVRAKSVIAPSS